MSTSQINIYYHQYFKQLVWFANKYVLDIDVAQDLVQDIFVHLLQKPDDKIENDRAYFYTAVKHRCLDYLKTENIHKSHHTKILQFSEKEFYQDALENTEIETQVFSLIEKLPNQCKIIFKESRFSGKNNQQIADDLKISKRTVETQISLALKKLREGLKDFKSLLLVFL